MFRERKIHYEDPASYTLSMMPKCNGCYIYMLGRSLNLHINL